MDDPGTIEAKGLRLTVWAALFMAALGIGFYFPTRSQAILLDGIFSGIGFFVSLLTLKVARLIKAPDDDEFQFGYAALEPLLNFGKGLMILAVCVFAAIPAVKSLFTGGRPLQSGPAVFYALIAAGGCFVMWAGQRRRARQVNSPLLTVDTHQWLMDGAISSAVGLAFIVGAILERGRFAAWVDYLDPVLVIVLVLATISVPISIVKGSLWELLLGAPPPEIRREVSAGITSVLEAEGLDTHRLRMIRSGRAHLLLLHVVLPEDDAGRCVKDLDGLRERLHATVPQSLQPFSLDVVFTRDPRWME